ncbi:MAG: hypothetical protein U0636_08015 [Phycisphaerales bacterium]
MRTLACVSIGALALTSLATADFVDLQFTGVGAGQMVKVTSPSRNGDVFAGQILFTLTNSTGINLDGNWILYCCDLGQTVSGSTNTYEVLPVSSVPVNGPMGAIKAAAIGDLYAAAGGNQYTNDNDFATAFQLAIWEVVTDYVGGPASLADITSGSFQATMTDSSPLSAGIAGYLSFLLNAIGTTNGANVLGLGNEGLQDQLIEVPGPGVLAAGAIGAVLSGARRRRA